MVTGDDLTTPLFYSEVKLWLGFKNRSITKTEMEKKQRVLRRQWWCQLEYREDLETYQLLAVLVGSTILLNHLRCLPIV